MMKRTLICAAGALIGALPLVEAAHATPLNVVAASLTIYNFPNPSPGDNNDYMKALPTNPGVGASSQVYTGTYTGPINFIDNGGGPSIADFLNTAPGGSFSGPITGLTQNISTATFQDATIMDFKFTISAEDIGTISHDDGVSIFQGTTNFLPTSAADPTVEVPTAFDLLPGTYDLWYAEVNGLPADLVMDVTSSVEVPEPGTLALFGLGLAGLGFLRRRRAV